MVVLPTLTHQIDIKKKTIINGCTGNYYSSQKPLHIPNNASNKIHFENVFTIDITVKTNTTY